MPVRIATVLLATAALMGGCATQQENPNYQYSSLYETNPELARARTASYTTPSPASAPVMSAPVVSAPLTSPVVRGPVASAPATPSAPSGLYSRVPSDCVATGTCAPESYGVASAAPTIAEPWASPTEERFAGDTTPGHQALSGDLDDGMSEDFGVAEQVAEIPDTTDTDATLPPPALPEPAPYTPPAAPQLPPSYDAQALPEADTEEGPPTLRISGQIHQATSGTQTRALMHRVEAGDTLFSLARRYCTDVASVRELNGLGPDFAIRSGQDLKLPARCE